MVLAMRMFLATCVAIVVVLTTTSFAGHKVFICHFNGHVSSNGTHDFLTLDLLDPACDSEGGRVLDVACQGAHNGHGVEVSCGVSK
jgi:hypothetical protein